MVLVIYATPDPIINENKILPIIDEAVEKTGFEVYTLIHSDHVSVVLEPDDENVSEIEAMMKFVKALEENPEYEKYKDFIVITT